MSALTNCPKCRAVNDSREPNCTGCGHALDDGYEGRMRRHFRDRGIPPPVIEANVAIHRSAALTDEQIDALRRIYNDAYCEQRRDGIGGGDAERHAMRELLKHVCGVAGQAVGARSDGLCDSGRVEFGIAPPTCPSEGAALSSELLPFPSVATDKAGLYAASSASGVSVLDLKAFDGRESESAHHDSDMAPRP